MAKDWVGGNAAVFKTLGASNHKNGERQREDYYATEPAATEWLCKIDRISQIGNNRTAYKRPSELQHKECRSRVCGIQKKKNRQGELCSGERTNCIAQIAIPRATTIPAEKFGGAIFKHHIKCA